MKINNLETCHKKYYFQYIFLKILKNRKQLYFLLELALICLLTLMKATLDPWACTGASITHSMHWPWALNIYIVQSTLSHSPTRRSKDGSILHPLLKHSTISQLPKRSPGLAQ